MVSGRTNFYRGLVSFRRAEQWDIEEFLPSVPNPSRRLLGQKFVSTKNCNSVTYLRASPIAAHSSPNMRLRVYGFTFDSKKTPKGITPIQVFRTLHVKSTL